jgi:hypothetical protein
MTFKPQKRDNNKIQHVYINADVWAFMLFRTLKLFAKDKSLHKQNKLNITFAGFDSNWKFQLKRYKDCFYIAEFSYKYYNFCIREGLIEDCDLVYKDFFIFNCPLSFNDVTQKFCNWPKPSNLYA